MTECVKEDLSHTTKPHSICLWYRGRHVFSSSWHGKVRGGGGAHYTTGLWLVH